MRCYVKCEFSIHEHRMVPLVQTDGQKPGRFMTMPENISHTHIHDGCTLISADGVQDFVATAFYSRRPPGNHVTAIGQTLLDQYSNTCSKLLVS
jgi:hypothetical protein